MKTRELHLLFLFLDLLLINVAVVVLTYIDSGYETANFRNSGELILILNGSWTIAYLLSIDGIRYLKADMKNMIRIFFQRFILFIAIMAISVIIFGLGQSSKTVLLGSNLLFLIFKTGLSFWLFFYFSARNRQNLRPLVIIGDNNIGEELLNYFKHNPYLGYKPLGIINNGFENSSSQKIIGRISDLQKIHDDYSVQDVIIALPVSEKQLIKEIIDVSERNGSCPHILPNYFGVINREFKVQTVGKVPLLNLRSIPLDIYGNRFWKRAFDLVAASILLMLLSPLFLVIAIAIKLESKGPVFYKPTRLGVHGEPFVVYKFRSMKVTNDKDNSKKSTILNDPRITTLGKFLRKSNLDELPQLLNVLNNEMSIIGPRPHRIHLNQTLQKKMNSYMVRHYVKPGITGWAQVNGWRGPTETKLQYTARTLHDLWYIENWNFAMDIYILYLTIFGKKTRKNAF